MTTDFFWLHVRSYLVHRSRVGESETVCGRRALGTEDDQFIRRDENYLSYAPPEARCVPCFEGTKWEVPVAYRPKNVDSQTVLGQLDHGNATNTCAECRTPFEGRNWLRRLVVERDALLGQVDDLRSVVVRERAALLGQVDELRLKRSGDAEKLVALARERDQLYEALYARNDESYRQAKPAIARAEAAEARVRELEAADQEKFVALARERDRAVRERDDLNDLYKRAVAELEDREARVAEQEDWEQLHDLLAGGKYTHWMLDLSADQLAGLLWLVGEYALRTRVQQVDRNDVMNRRTIASNGLAAFRRTPLTLEEVKQFIRDSVQDMGRSPSDAAQQTGAAIEAEQATRRLIEDVCDVVDAVCEMNGACGVPGCGLDKNIKHDHVPSGIYFPRGVIAGGDEGGGAPGWLSQTQRDTRDAMNELAERGAERAITSGGIFGQPDREIGIKTTRERLDRLENLADSAFDRVSRIESLVDDLIRKIE